MEIIKPRTLSGFMELLPEKQLKFDRMAEVLRKTYASYGFAPLDTPVIEDAQILLAKGGGETEKQIYRFTKGDSDLALRFDLTVPLAKYVALHYNELAFPFRRYQISKVYRGERAQRGRFREFYQADIDIIGDGKLDILNEAEIPAIIYKVFKGFGLTRFQIHVNNRKVLNGFYAMMGLTEKSGDIMRTVDKLDKIGVDKVKVILLEDCGLTEQQADEILAFISIKGTNAEVLAALENYAGRNETFDVGFSELKVVASNLAAFGMPEENFVVDLTIARGLDYYTGTVYETLLLDHPELGSVCSGGRYDNLAGYYIEKQLPGVGISIGLTRLFYVLDEQGLLNPELPSAPADALVLPMGDIAPAIALAETLRSSGLRVQLYCEQKKFKQKMAYADKLKVPFAVLLGEDEIAEGKCSVKNMKTGEQLKLTPAEAAEHIKASLDAETGTLILETQQSSDVTYRLYDYDRPGTDGKLRPLHIEQSLDCIDFDAQAPTDGTVTAPEVDGVTELESNPCYTVDRVRVNGSKTLDQRWPFMCLSVIDGEGTVCGDPVHKGSHLLAPSTVSSIDLEGKMELIISHL